MANMDRNGDGERKAPRPARATNFAWLSEAATWFAVATTGMFIVFAGLAVDAYKHNHSTTNETLLSLSNPGHLLAAIGLALTALSVLAGLSIARSRARNPPSMRSAASCPSPVRLPHSSR